MYEFIKGKLVQRNPSFAVIESNGIGYFLNISIQTYTRLKEDDACMLYTHLVVKEDDLSLFGFADVEERELFRLLISVSGVGVNTARVILSSLTTDEIIQAIVSGNAPMLQRIKGIGSKTAQRIIIDLKDKLSREPITQEKVEFVHNTKRDEALSGLITLGFQKMAAAKALDKVIGKNDPSLPVEELIRNALKIL